MYKIRYAPRVEKYIRKLNEKSLKSKIRDALLQIQENPYCGEAKTGDLQGIFCLDVYYNKTNYEIAYSIENDDTIVIIILIGTRENFYNELKRYM